GLCARDLTQRNEDLADAHQRTRLSIGVAKLPTKLEASLERLQGRSHVRVASVVDEQPAEHVERGSELLQVIKGRPGVDSSLEQSPAGIRVAGASRESTGCGQRPRAFCGFVPA